MNYIYLIILCLALAGCGGGGSAADSGTNTSSVGKSKNGFKLVTSNYLLTACPISASVSTNGWYKCLEGTSFTGYIDLFNKRYCEIAIGNDGAFHYITDTEHLTTTNSMVYSRVNNSSGIYSLINNGPTLGPYLIASLSSDFPITSQINDFSIDLLVYSNRFYSFSGGQILYPSEIDFHQKSGGSTNIKSRVCYINSLD